MEPTMELLGRKTSYNVQKVAWVIAELGLECTQVDLGGEFGGLDKPEYIDLNPNKRVPTLIDDGQVLWESNTICRYLVDKYGANSRLSGDTAVDRARGDMWMEWYQNNAYANAIALFHQVVKLPPSQRSVDKRKAAIDGFTEKLAIFDAALAGQRFILGDELSLGDIPTGAFLYRYFTLDFERPPLVHLDRYFQDLKTRPAYQDAVMVDYSSLIGVD